MMRDDAEHVLPNVVAVDAVDVQAIEDGGRWRDACLLMVDRSNPSVDERGGQRLAEIVANRANHDDNLPSPIEIVDSGPRLIDHEQRVNPDITFGMPFGLLFAADEGVNFGEHAFDDAEIERKLEPDGRASGVQQELFDFAPDPLGRKIVERNPA